MTKIIPLIALGAAIALPVRAQTADIEIDLQVGAKKYQARGAGECKAAPQAAIYGVRAALYSASHRADGRSLRLTLWRPKDGAPDMVQLDVSEGSARQSVDTVKAGAKKDTKGSGKAVFQPSGEGGTFTVDAVSAAGEKIRGTVRCLRFGAIRAEGG